VSPSVQHCTASAKLFPYQLFECLRNSNIIGSLQNPACWHAHCFLGGPMERMRLDRLDRTFFIPAAIIGTAGFLIVIEILQIRGTLFSHFWAALSGGAVGFFLTKKILQFFFQP
jgi:hypothetical protein